MGTPGFGVQGTGYPAAGEWGFTLGWRYQESDRHFVGDEYQGRRDELGNQVINHVNLADLNIRYQASLRTELSLGIPIFMATRSQTYTDPTTRQLTRYQTAARGIGDVFFSARRWTFDPDTHPGGNLQLGVGVKIPTGQNNSTDTFKVVSGGTVTNQIRTVDQSIQPGDGGFGVLVDFNTFTAIAGGKASLYAGGAYLSTPGEKSNVQTYRNGAGEEVMSIADQYLARGGIAFPIPRSVNMTFSGGVRLEGVPVKDIIGGDTGFRRPGIAVSIEPAVNMIVKGRNAVTLAVPFAIYRNRFQSVPDMARGTHGDAAFADYLILAGYSRKF
jgi:hypothetical protein